LHVLYAFLRHHGIVVSVLDMALELGYSHNSASDVARYRGLALALLRKQDFDIAAISCWTSLQFLSSCVTAELCKEVNPDGLVVVGGYHPDAVPTDFAYPNSPFDVVVRGEGEQALLELARSPATWPGRGLLTEATPRVVSTAPSSVDFPLCWDDYPYFTRQHLYSDYAHGTRIGVVFSRGCPFKCAFCVDGLRDLPSRLYSVDRAVQELETIVRLHRPDEIYIADPLFGVQKPWRREFFQRLIDQKWKTQLYLNTRCDLIEDEDVELMGRLPLRMYIGLESMSHTMLGVMNKATNTQRYLERFAAASDALDRRGLIHYAGLIFNYPGETTATVHESISNMEQMIREKRRSSLGLSGHSYKLFPGSDVYDRRQYFVDRYGAWFPHPEWWKEAGANHFYLSTEVVPSRELLLSNNLNLYAEMYRQLLDRYRDRFVEALPEDLIDQSIFRSQWRQLRLRVDQGVCYPRSDGPPVFFDKNRRILIDPGTLEHALLSQIHNGVEPVDAVATAGRERELSASEIGEVEQSLLDLLRRGILVPDRTTTQAAEP
jgi:radical SAM superfamily enzyme YgiQ (UPF0313 family)